MPCNTSAVRVRSHTSKYQELAMVMTHLLLRGTCCNHMLLSASLTAWKVKAVQPAKHSAKNNCSCYTWSSIASGVFNANIMMLVSKIPTAVEGLAVECTLCDTTLHYWSGHSSG